MMEFDTTPSGYAWFYFYVIIDLFRHKPFLFALLAGIVVAIGTAALARRR